MPAVSTAGALRRLPRLQDVVLLFACALAGCSGDAAGEPADPVLARLYRALPRFDAAQRGEQPEIRRVAALAFKLIRQGKHEEARDILAPLFAELPESNDARFVEALSFHKEKRYAEARPLWERVIERGPTFANARASIYFYAWCLYYLGEAEHARAAFETYVKLAPDDADARFGLGLIAFAEGEIERAESEFCAAIERFDAERDATGGAKTRARLAEVRLARGDVEGARDLLTRCIAMDPTAYEAYYKLSRVQQRLGRDAEAAANLARYEELRRLRGRE